MQVGNQCNMLVMHRRGTGESELRVRGDDMAANATACVVAHHRGVRYAPAQPAGLFSTPRYRCWAARPPQTNGADNAAFSRQPAGKV